MTALVLPLALLGIACLLLVGATLLAIARKYRRKRPAKNGKAAPPVPALF